jgi:hypothetical protein
MKESFTLDELAEFSRKERAIFETLTGTIEEQNLPKSDYQPSKLVVNNVLNYSKALSVRKSENLKEIKLILN